MIEIFDIDNRTIVPNQSVLIVPELKAIVDTYEDYIPALCYVAFLTDPTVRNPYGNILKEARSKMLLEEYPGSYKITDLVICNAIKKLEELNDTVINKYYRQVRSLLARYGNWAETVIIDDSKDGNITHIRNMVKDFSVVAKQFTEVEKLKIEEEQKNKGKFSNSLY